MPLIHTPRLNPLNVIVWLAMKHKRDLNNGGDPWDRCDFRQLFRGGLLRPGKRAFRAQAVPRQNDVGQKGQEC